MRAVVFSLLALAACSDVAPAERPGPDAAPVPACVLEGAHRCVGQSFETCVDGSWANPQTCTASAPCTEEGCGRCDRARPTVCLADDLHACTIDGTIGDLLQGCAHGCVDGACLPQADCEPGSELVYLVDSDADLLAFDPGADPVTMDLVAPVNCPVAAPWPALAARGELSARPLSMSVDRSGRAWILYTSGEIFWVGTHDGSCVASPFVRGDAGFQLFSMGFVADAAGSDHEHLYLVGGPADTYLGDFSLTQLGVVDPTAVTTATLGPMAVSTAEPELTGTGQGELWAYFPGGTDPPTIARLDLHTGARLASYALPPAGGETAWAFAHHGGRFYIFRTVTDPDTHEDTNQVLRFDPANGGQVDLLLASTPYQIVGAGVSTCAPVVD